MLCRVYIYIFTEGMLIYLRFGDAYFAILRIIGVVGGGAGGRGAVIWIIEVLVISRRSAHRT